MGVSVYQITTKLDVEVVVRTAPFSRLSSGQAHSAGVGECVYTHVCWGSWRGQHQLEKGSGLSSLVTGLKNLLLFD